MIEQESQNNIRKINNLKLQNKLLKEGLDNLRAQKTQPLPKLDSDKMVELIEKNKAIPNILLEKRDSNIPVQTYGPLPKLDSDKWWN